MNPNEFSSALTGLWQRIDILQRRAYELQTSPPSLTVDLLEELNMTLEELRIAEEELHQQTEQLAMSCETIAGEHQRYRELFEFAPDGYVVTDPLGVITEANHAAAILLNVPQEHLLRKPLAVYIALHDREAFRRQLIWLQESAGGREWEVQVQPRHKPGFPAVLSCTASRDAQSKAVGLRWLLHDVSERKRVEEAIRQANQLLEHQVEERTLALQTLNDQLRQDIAQREVVEGQLRASLREKDVLLRELHHRVKNNMQIVSSILNLQAGQVEEPHVRELFQESHHRIHTMALIHDTVYGSSDVANINLGSFTATLTAYLTKSYGVEGDRVTLRLQADAVTVPLDTAIPYGLILNELVSNCLKHAFPEGQSGQIQVTLRRHQSSQATLTVQDNGCGFPAEKDFHHPGSLGLQLVQALAGQLHGTIALEESNSMAVMLTFHW